MKLTRRSLRSLAQVGYEFDVDKTKLGSYGTDYLIGE